MQDTISHADLEKPLPTELQDERARDHYLQENGFSVAEYDSPRTAASVFGIRFTVPNTPKHRWAIMLHDLHHVATGYGTDSSGACASINSRTRSSCGA